MEPNVKKRKIWDWIIEEVHKNVPELKELVEKNFDLNKEVIKSCVGAAYLRAASIYRDKITKGAVTDPYTEIFNLIEGYGFLQLPFGLDVNSTEYKNGLKRFKEFDEFRYKNEEAFFEFLDKVVKNLSKIRDAIVGVEITYII